MKTLTIYLAILFLSHLQGYSQSIHKEQSEAYSKYNYTNVNQWDELRFQQNGVGPEIVNISPAACTLNKKVFGWNPYWSGSTYLNYDWNLLSHLCHFSYEVNASTGNAISTHSWLTDPAVTAAQTNGVKVSLCATLFSNHATFLNSSTAKQTFISNIISLVQQRNGNGCNIDFEGVLQAQSASFTSFMIDLCNQMHTAIPGSEVSIALPAVDWSAVYDVASMVNYVDLFIIMGYDYYWSGSSTAGPTDPLYNFDTPYNYTLPKSITYYLSKSVPKAKLLLGLPYYGREWSTQSATIPSSTTASGTTRTYNYIRNNANGNYSTPLWDQNSFSQYFSFTNGVQKQCFINSGHSMGKRFDIVNQYGIGGIGIWALGQDDGYPDYWNKIRDKFSNCGIIPCSDTIYDLGGPNRNHYDKENYFYTISPYGAASVSLAFYSFNTELNYDSLWLYNGPSTSSPLIGGYTGTNSPGIVNSTGPALTIRWKSDNTIQNSGWNATWSCGPPTGTTNNTDTQSPIAVFPNPFREYTVLKLENTEQEGVELEIMDVYGRFIRHSRTNTSQFIIERGSLAKGIYFLNVKTENRIIKLVVE